jgi:hypothetical protein
LHKIIATVIYAPTDTADHHGLHSELETVSKCVNAL